MQYAPRNPEIFLSLLERRLNSHKQAFILLSTAGLHFSDGEI